jgi:4-amino-4-deoxy-L-arabinose transferase-like glycosyltransferase
VLAVTANRYGYHPDELYFRMLPPAWGYTDQPPLTPLLARTMSALVDQPWALRIPAMLAAAASVLIVGAITRELGGGRFAQGLAAWGYGFGAFTLVLGHVLLTASIDLVVWPLVVLLVLRALLRKEDRWWLLAGLVVGVSMYNKLLVAILLVGIGAGLVAMGPRSAHVRRTALAGLVLALAVGAPNLVYQATHGWPQLSMGASLSSHNGAGVRPFVIPFLIVLLGPPLVPVWIAGIVALVRRPEWRRIRFLVVTFPVAVGLVVIAGSQFYYEYGLLAAVYAVGCIPAAEWAVRTGRAWVPVVCVVVNAAICTAIALPWVPVGDLGATPIPAIDQVTRLQVGWPRYAQQVQRVAATQSSAAIVLTADYGEAGAIDRYAPGLAARVYSGHNALHDLHAPPADVQTVVVVGYGMDWVPKRFSDCRVAGHLDAGVRLVSEEQGAPIRVCTGPTVSMATIWQQAGRIG